MSTEEKDFVFKISIDRSERTPTSEAWMAIKRASDALFSAAKEYGEAEAMFQEILISISEMKATGDDALEELHASLDQNPTEAGRNFFIHSLTICCAFAIEGMREEKHGNLSRAWSLISDSNYWAGTLGMLSASASEREEAMNGLASSLAARGAAKKLENDPKQMEKRFVRECWENWQKSPTLYKSSAQFARDMLDKCELLESTQVIERWCRQWKSIEPAE